MSSPFEQSRINSLCLANRFVRSATWSGLADEEGRVTPRLIALLKDLAAGGVGLIITGHAYVHSSGRHSPRQLGIDRDELLEGLQRLTASVHAEGGRIAVQLGYGGAYLSKSRLRGLTAEHLHSLADSFAIAAKRAKAAGFDGVQIFAAHGFLLSQFLSPRYNDRTDDYGGSIDNRTRLLREVLAAVRRAVGGEFPVLAKINAEDFVEGGLTMADALRVAAMLEKEGIDAIELSGGLLNNPHVLHDDLDTEEKEVYFRRQAGAFKERLSVPLILVGGIRSFAVASQLIADGFADYISMSRPFICEPALVKRWQSGDLGKAACISCNNCIESAKTGKGIRCVPIKKTPETTFFPQETKTMPAGAPHPEGTNLLITTGLARKEEQFLPAVKIETEYDGKVCDHGLFFGLDGDDSLKVRQVITESLGKKS